MNRRATMVHRLVAGRGIGLTYAGIVVAVQVWLAVVPPATRAAVVAACSTNLANLRQYPPAVLAASAFVLATPGELVLVPVMVLAFGAVQRWLGRAATVIMAVLAHVGATVMVATLLTARVHRGEAARSVTSSVDVGISYGIAGMLGLLTARVPGRFRRWLIAGVSAGLLAVVAVSRQFTDLGHLMAWGIGVAAATLVRRAAAAAPPRRREDLEAPEGRAAAALPAGEPEPPGHAGLNRPVMPG